MTIETEVDLREDKARPAPLEELAEVVRVWQTFGDQIGDRETTRR